MMAQEILTFPEAAEFMRMPKPVLRRLIKEKRINCINLGRKSYRFRKSDLVKMFDVEGNIYTPTEATEAPCPSGSESQLFCRCAR